jgi:hypothetical protein
MQNSLPIPRSRQRTQRSRRAHVENDTRCTTVHHTIDIRIPLVNDELELDGPRGAGIQDFDRGHDVLVIAVEGGGRCY